MEPSSCSPLALAPCDVRHALYFVLAWLLIARPVLPVQRLHTHGSQFSMSCSLTVFFCSKWHQSYARNLETILLNSCQIISLPFIGGTVLPLGKETLFLTRTPKCLFHPCFQSAPSQPVSKWSDLLKMTVKVCLLKIHQWLPSSLGAVVSP